MVSNCVVSLALIAIVTSGAGLLLDKGATAGKLIRRHRPWAVWFSAFSYFPPFLEIFPESARS